MMKLALIVALPVHLQLRENMFRHLLVLVGFGLAAGAMLYAWWRAVLTIHEWREKFYGDKDRIITLFTYRPKRNGR
jgi:hypothetical protein